MSSRRLAVIMFTDLIGFTKLFERDEEPALRLDSSKTLCRLGWAGYRVDMEGLRREYTEAGWHRFGEWVARVDRTRLPA